MRGRHISITVVLAILAFCAGRLSAATDTVDSPDLPENTESFTLEDIYNRLDTGAPGAPSTFTEPVAAPGTGTMHDPNAIMAKAPAIDSTNGATETHVLDGKTFWGLTAGQWATVSGTMPNNGAVTIVPTTTNQAIAMGFHDGAGVVEGDGDLVAEKIKQGEILFGVAGEVIESTGDASAADVLTGTTFSNAGAAGIPGEMPDNGATDYIPGPSDQTVDEGYHNGSGKVKTDADLVPGKIRSEVDLFGVVGKCHGVAATGQTACWNEAGNPIACAGTGHDGDYQLGCLPKIGPCMLEHGCGTNRGFTANVDNNGDGDCVDDGEVCDGTVTDNLTGLIWLRNAGCWSGGSWNGALLRAGSLMTGTCGLTDGSAAGDWRLPNYNELRSLVNPQEPGPSAQALLPGHPFTGVQPKYYWTSTTYTEGFHQEEEAYLVSLVLGGKGRGGRSDKDYADPGYYTWPVRGGR